MGKGFSILRVMNCEARRTTGSFLQSFIGADGDLAVCEFGRVAEKKDPFHRSHSNIFMINCKFKKYHIAMPAWLA